MTERINLELSIANLVELTAGVAAGPLPRQLAKYKVPANFIDKLPRTAGKALKRELRNR